jgi:hypothetical protein
LEEERVPLAAVSEAQLDGFRWVSSRMEAVCEPFDFRPGRIVHVDFDPE